MVNDAYTDAEGPPPRGSLKKAFAAQFRLIRALVLRDMMTQYAESRAGYIWRIIIPILTIVVFFGLRFFRGGGAFQFNPYFPFAIFLVTSFPYWMAFRDTYTRVLTATDRNDPLLVVPHVTVLDMILAKAVAEIVGNVLYFLVLAIGASVLFEFPPERPAEVLIMYIVASWLGAAMGLLMCPVHRMFPTVTILLNVFLRVGMWISGVLFTMRQIPPAYWPYLSWNPVLHITEGVRQYWSSNYQSPIYSPTYVVGCAFTMTALGLLLERGSRRFMGP